LLLRLLYALVNVSRVLCFSLVQFQPSHFYISPRSILCTKSHWINARLPSHNLHSASQFKSQVGCAMCSSFHAEFARCADMSPRLAKTLCQHQASNFGVKSSQKRAYKTYMSVSQEDVDCVTEKHARCVDVVSHEHCSSHQRPPRTTHSYNITHHVSPGTVVATHIWDL
jgi:hypothetical protein